MPRTYQSSSSDKAGTFFFATLVLWFVSVLFEIVFNKRRELLYVVAGGCFYQIANWVIRVRVSRDPLFVNTSVSLLHSTITSTSVVFILVNQWLRTGFKRMFDHTQLVEGTWPWAYQALCFSCGYFAYDQWDMLHYHLYSGVIPAILMHHLILLICFTLALYRHVTVNYLILTLICELHSIFLHVRKVRRMVGVRDAKSKVVKVEWVLNWIMFVLARIISHVLITVKLIKDASKFEKGVEWPLAMFGMAGMNLLNAFLGIDLFNAFKREKNPQQNNQKRRE
ncbi:TRAM, LAG1 and CLN8 (TLC) lipid-sensing domain containing protein [Theobroma cacao]|uniref:TRAM, LAG1 and CLN8 (TLC) lipid-sensing domain containing protein n=1 Tax=Theobroma cacao TaxID=3641 RepID=A0A061FGW2_THECC|nr:TRAM, LAG1 and CLN8 (TLC) lipid-sensing domain containing protein [Theobroma cacao]